ncbi:MAG: hypothetical protein ABEJ74_08805 [Haloferacaceae archaeon]
MVPDISRRAVLAGAGLAGLVGAVGVAPAEWLPEPVARERTELRPVPEIDAYPPVSSEHEAAARDSLATTIDRAERAVERVPPDAEPPGIFDPESALRSAEGYAESARDASGWQALADARLGAKFAGEAIGLSRVMTGDASGEHLASQAEEIQAQIEKVRDDVSYAVDDASAGLARLYWVEKLLALGHLNSYRDGTYVGQDEPSTTYDDRTTVSTWGNHLMARRYADDAARLLRDYRAGTTAPTSLQSHVEAVEADLRAEARGLTPDSTEFDRRNREIEAMDSGPFRRFSWQVFYARQNADVRDPGGPWAGVPLHRAVKNAETVLTCRGCFYARDETEFGPGGSVTGSMLADAKRDALRRLTRYRQAARDRPLLLLMLREPRRLLWAGGEDLDGATEREFPKAEAYAKYLRAVGYLRNVESVTSRIDRPER